MFVAALIAATILSGTPMSELQTCKVPQQAAAMSAVRQLNQEYIDAARTSDGSWFHKHMAEDVVVVLSNGRRVGKRDFLTMLRDEPKPYASLTSRDVTVRVFGPTVQVDADAPWEMRDGQTGVSRYIDTYAWIDCRWQVISAQITALPKPVGS